MHVVESHVCMGLHVDILSRWYKLLHFLMGGPSCCDPLANVDPVDPTIRSAVDSGGGGVDSVGADLGRSAIVNIVNVDF